MTGNGSEQREQTPPEELHQGADLNIRALVLVTGGLVLLIALAIVGADLLTPDASNVAGDRAPIDPARVDEPPDPRITQSHRVQRRQLEERVDERLSTYGWIDREQGVARIPIDRAVELVLERGLPSRIQPDTGQTNVPPLGANSGSGQQQPAQED